MSKIDVNIVEARLANSKLLFIRDIIDDVTRQVIHLQSTIDPRVLDQNNLLTRLNNSRNNLISIDGDLRDLHAGIANMLNRYEETDIHLRSKVSLGELMGNPGTSRNINAFTIDAATNITTANHVAERVKGVNTGAITTGSASSAMSGIIERINDANVSGR